MANTIGNPLSWVAQQMGSSGAHAIATAQELGSDAATPTEIRQLTHQDLLEALHAGVQDFTASRTDAMFIVLIYPVIGLVLMGFGLQLNLLPLLFPLLGGFALLGPVAAIGLYEISRRREKGEPAGWLTALRIVQSPSLGAVVALGLYLAVWFVLWMLTANAIHAVTMGPSSPASVAGFARDVLTTGAGWAMIAIGCGVGFLFAAVALAVSLVSFPLLIDRHVGVPQAVVTSVQVTRENPRIVLTWGAIVAAGLMLGALPMLLGLIVVFPVLGHATWHLYRRAVV